MDNYQFSFMPSFWNLNLFMKVYNYVRPTKKKKILLDPISCICKLSLLSFLAKGTKLSIKTYTLQIQEPTLLTPIQRYYNSDCKEDIGLLFIPIIKFIEWYLNNTYQHSEHLYKIIIFAIKGLESLILTYHDNETVTLTIHLYIALLTEAYEKICTFKQLCDKYKISSIDENISQIIYDRNIDKCYYNLETFQTISMLITLCAVSTQEETKHKCTETILSIIDSQDILYKQPLTSIL